MKRLVRFLTVVGHQIGRGRFAQKDFPQLVPERQPVPVRRLADLHLIRQVGIGQKDRRHLLARAVPQAQAPAPPAAATLPTL